MWWSQIMRGPRRQIGERNGIPFQISTRPSQAPMDRVISAMAVRGNTEYLLPYRLTL